MGVDLATYSAGIGTFISRRNVSDDDERRRIVHAMWRRKNLSIAMVTTNLKLYLYAVAERFTGALVAISFILIKQLLLLLSGDVETNPGPLGQHSEGKLLFVIYTSLKQNGTKKTKKQKKKLTVGIRVKASMIEA